MCFAKSPKDPRAKAGNLRRGEFSAHAERRGIHFVKSNFRKRGIRMKKSTFAMQAFRLIWIMAAVGAMANVCFSQPAYTDSFHLEDCTFATFGQNRYFVLEPGFQEVLEGEEDGAPVHLTITVLDQTQVINGIRTRVVEERELQNGELAEVSRNYFAICMETNTVFYFGEDVDIYQNGRIVDHPGVWHAGVNGAKAGPVMPGIILLGSRYQQEVAPPVAMDRAEITSMGNVITTRAGTFQDCVGTLETSPLEPGTSETKFYAPGIGLVKNEGLELVSYGYVAPGPPREISIEILKSGRFRLHWKTDVSAVWHYQIILFNPLRGWIESQGPSGNSLWHVVDYGGAGYDKGTADYLQGWADFTVPKGGYWVFLRGVSWHSPFPAGQFGMAYVTVK